MMDIDFLNVFYGENDATNFTACLFRLIAKADPQNLARLAMVYQEEVALYHWWMSSPTPPAPEQVRMMMRRIQVLCFPS